MVPTADAGKKTGGSSDSSGKKGSGSSEVEVSDEDVAQIEGKYARIKLGGIKEFQGTWEEAKALQSDLTMLEVRMLRIDTGFKTAVGVGRNQPLQTAFDQLKADAQGKLRVVNNGGEITLSASDAVPDNVEQGIDAANLGVSESKAIVLDAKAYPDQVKKLIETASAMPDQLTPEILQKNNMTLQKSAKQLTVIKDNLKALKETPARIEGIVASATGFVKGVKSLATGDEGGSKGGGSKGGGSKGGGKKSGGGKKK
jgi:uncharacterized membrane protein YgcG